MDQYESSGLETVDDDWLCVFAVVSSGESGKLIPDWTASAHSNQPRDMHGFDDDQTPASYLQYILHHPGSS